MTSWKPSPRPVRGAQDSDLLSRSLFCEESEKDAFPFRGAKSPAWTFCDPFQIRPSPVTGRNRPALLKTPFRREAREGKAALYRRERFQPGALPLCAGNDGTTTLRHRLILRFRTFEKERFEVKRSPEACRWPPSRARQKPHHRGWRCRTEPCDPG